jgi:hypothetical protein
MWDLVPRQPAVREGGQTAYQHDNGQLRGCQTGMPIRRNGTLVCTQLLLFNELSVATH